MHVIILCSSHPYLPRGWIIWMCIPVSHSVCWSLVHSLHLCWNLFLGMSLHVCVRLCNVHAIGFNSRTKDTLNRTYTRRFFSCDSIIFCSTLRYCTFECNGLPMEHITHRICALVMRDTIFSSAMRYSSLLQNAAYSQTVQRSFIAFCAPIFVCCCFFLWIFCYFLSVMHILTLDALCTQQFWFAVCILFLCACCVRARALVFFCASSITSANISHTIYLFISVLLFALNSCNWSMNQCE